MRLYRIHTSGSQMESSWSKAAWVYYATPARTWLLHTVQESGRAQSHDRDQACGSALVAAVWRVNRYQARPESGPFFFSHPLRGNKEASTAHRELSRGIGLEVEIPTWVLRPTTLRCDDNEVVSIGEIQKGTVRNRPDLRPLVVSEQTGAPEGKRPSHLPRVRR